MAYRGPSTNNYDSYDLNTLKYNGQSHRPTNIVGSGYYNPYLSKHGFYGALNPKDRISLGGGKLFLICRVLYHAIFPTATADQQLNLKHCFFFGLNLLHGKTCFKLIVCQSWERETEEESARKMSLVWKEKYFKMIAYI